MSREKVRTPRILHCHPGFPEGETTRLLIDVIHALGDGFSHETTAAGDVPGTHVATAVPDITGRPSPGRLVGLARAMSGYDLVLTYGWGAINVALAHKVFGQSFALPALIHHEIGWADAAEQEFTFWRNSFRRIALGSAQSVVVETVATKAAATSDWHVPPERIAFIPRGVCTSEFSMKAARDALPGLIKREGEFWIGVNPAVGEVASAGNLVQALAHLPEEWHLLVMGPQESAQALRQVADVEELSHRVHIAGQGADLPVALSLVDIFVDLGSAHSAAVAAKQAMAAGKPVIAAADSAGGSALSPDNRKLLETGLSPDNLATALNKLTLAPTLRAELGKANKMRASELFEHAAMVSRYCRIYKGALSGNAQSA